MQSRRLQLSGGSTFVVSLPKMWVEEIGAGAGDDIFITKNPNKSLTLTPGSNSTSNIKRATIEIGPSISRESIRRRIIATYLAGYQYIRVIPSGSELLTYQMGIIRDLLHSTMIGTEIVESSSKSISIQVLTGLPEIAFGVTIQRMHKMIMDMHRDAVRALVTGDRQLAEEVITADDEIDRFALYVLRNLTMAIQDTGMLRKMGLGGSADCLICRMVIYQMERVADHAVLIARHTKDSMDARTRDAVSGMSDDALGILDQVVRSLIEKDYHAAEAAADHIPVIIRKHKEAISILDTEIRLAIDSIGRTIEYSGDIAKAIIDRSVPGITARGEL